MPTKRYPTPLDLYGELFVQLHQKKVLPDGKKISDAIPRQAVDSILLAYHNAKDSPSFDLSIFFETHFEVKTDTSDYLSDRSKTPGTHIKLLWSVLMRDQDQLVAGSSLIPLPYPYIVPGGRFNEIYYWDSYFTMLGLQLHSEIDVIQSMIDNFSWLIDQFGFIPNGNRSYFLSRSQPPFYAQMLRLLQQQKGESVILDYLPSLLREYDYWSDASVHETKHKVNIAGGSMARYYDRSDTARQEMYGDDLHLLEKEKADVSFQELRSACESGWDFSSRWQADATRLYTTCTTDLLPVDLNCLIYDMELLISEAYTLLGAVSQSSEYSSKALNRKKLIMQYCWNDQLGYFSDYDHVAGAIRSTVSCAGMYPLYFGIANQNQAERAIVVLENELLRAGGLLTTTIYSGQQWDAPNGWAPLQWMSVMGLHRYGFIQLAKEIATRWIHLNEKVYANTGKFVEKYNVVDMSLEAGGGEYPVQDGFGWSNGVYLALKNYIKNN